MIFAFHPQGTQYVKIPLCNPVKFRGNIPEGKLKTVRVTKTAAGWFATFCFNSTRTEIIPTGQNEVGIDPGLNNLITITNTETNFEKIKNPRFFEKSALRLAQAQRGGIKQLTAKLQWRTANQKHDHHHKLSLKLARENAIIYWSDDNFNSLKKKHGKSYGSAALGKLRDMTEAKIKCRSDGSGKFVLVPSANSTKTCSTCGSLTGPTGLTGLAVRLWRCEACGALHDRDVNAGLNTKQSGQGMPTSDLVTDHLKSGKTVRRRKSGQDDRLPDSVQ